MIINETIITADDDRIWEAVLRDNDWIQAAIINVDEVDYFLKPNQHIVASSLDDALDIFLGKKHLKMEFLLYSEEEIDTFDPKRPNGTPVRGYWRLHGWCQEGNFVPNQPATEQEAWSEFKQHMLDTELDECGFMTFKSRTEIESYLALVERLSSPT